MSEALLGIVWIGVVLIITVVVNFDSRLKEGGLALALLLAGAFIFLGSDVVSITEITTKIYLTIISSLISALAVYLVLRE